MLSPEQCRAADAIEQFIADCERNVFVLHGLAGTGKSTVLAHIACRYPNALLCTPTGKAASVLRRKAGLPACTLHSAFKRLIKVSRDTAGRERMEWCDAHGEQELAGELLLLDEASMVNEEMVADLRRTGVKIVACGDPGQLPPVTGAPFFTRPDVVLQTIHRQALDSPIIRQAHAVRAGGRYQNDGPKFRLVGEASDDDVLGADVVLTWRNDTRHRANIEARRLRGLVAANPQAGEPVLCFKSAPEFGIFNGATYRLLRPFRPNDRTILLDVDGDQVAVPDVGFEGMTPSGERERVSWFGYGYALTVHKAQGSEFESVLLVDEHRQAERARWLYTALTRAADRITIITG